MVGESTFKKYIWIALTVFLGVSVVLGYQLTNVRFDYNFEKFFPADDDDTDYFLEYRKRFQSDNDFLLIAVERKAGVFDESFLRKVDEFTKVLESTDIVTYVHSITNLEEQKIYPGGISTSEPYVNFEDFQKEKDSARIYKNAELVNTVVAEDGKSICLFLRHEDYISKKKSDQLINDVEAASKKFDFEKVRVAGRIVGQRYYIDKMTYEMMLFIVLSAFLIVLFLFIAFRSGWGILIPQIVIMGSMVWVIGLMGVFNEPINIILSILPSIMFVVTMSDVIHLVSRYLDALRTEDSVYKAIMLAVREVGLATFLTSVTTAVGFFSLYFVKVQPIQAFGIVMGFGVLIAFILTFLLLPILFYLFPGPKYIRQQKKRPFWKKHLARAFIFILHKRIGILAVSGGVILISIIGITQIRTNNFLMDDLKPEETLKQDFDYLDKHYGGVRPFELSVTIKDSTKNVWNLEILQTLETVENYLEKEYGVSINNSLVKTLSVANRGAHGGDKDEFKIPQTQKKIRTYRRMIRMVDRGEFARSFIDSTETNTRISGSIPDLGNIVVTKKNDALLDFLKDQDMNGTIEYRITGTANLIDKNLKYLSESLMKGLAVSILIVALIIGLIYRSGTILVISIVTNILPLLFIAGFMGYFGIELKTSTAIIFTIAFGIAVDDTIHFLGKFKHELLKGKGKLYALKSSYMITGKAMILTTLILCSGFILLVFSSFLGTFYMGLLLSITLFVALIADMTLLPVLILLFYKERKK